MKRKMYAIFDTETVGNLSHPYVYDLAMVIVDKKGKIYDEQRWLIKEVFDNRPLMVTNSFLPKRRYDLYLKMVEAEGLTELQEVVYQVDELLQYWEVEVISAYNLQFDLNALSITSQEYLDSPFFHKQYQLLDLWNLACDTIFQHKQFAFNAKKNGWLTENGNFKTSAEIAYRYISGKKYLHPHMALEDCYTEVKIFAHCMRQKRKVEFGIHRHPWKKVAPKVKGE